MEQLAAPVDGEQGVDDPTHPLGRQCDHHELVPVGQLDRHDVALADPPVTQPEGEQGDVALELGISVDGLPVAVDDSHAPGICRGHRFEAARKGRGVPPPIPAVGDSDARARSPCRGTSTALSSWTKLRRVALGYSPSRPAARCLSRRVVDSPDGWTTDGRVLPMMVVHVEPAVQGTGPRCS